MLLLWLVLVDLILSWNKSSLYTQIYLDTNNKSYFMNEQISKIVLFVRKQIFLLIFALLSDFIIDRKWSIFKDKRRF